MHKFSCYETLAQLIDICKTVFFSLIAFHYSTDFRNIVLKIIFPILTQAAVEQEKRQLFWDQFWGSIIWTDTLSPIQIFLQLQVQLNTAQYFVRLNVVISLVCETVSCVM